MSALATFTFGGLSFRWVLVHLNLILPCREAASRAFYLVQSRIFLKLRGSLLVASLPGRFSSSKPDLTPVNRPSPGFFPHSKPDFYETEGLRRTVYLSPSSSRRTTTF